MTMTAEFGVNPVYTNSGSGPNVVKLADGGFVIVWYGGGSNPTLSSPAVLPTVRAQYYNADGTARGGQIIVDTGSYDAVTGTFVQTNAISGTQLSNGNIAFIWQSTEQSGGGASDIQARIYDANGVSVTSEFTITSEPINSQYPSDIIALADGKFAVVWDTTQFPADSASFGEVTARIFASDGTAVAGEFTVNSTLAGKQSEARAAVLANADFVIAWVDRGSAGYSPDHTIRTQRFDSAGAPLGGEVSLTQPTGTNQSVFFPSITGLSDGGYIVAWSFGVGLNELRGQKFDGNGQAVSGVITLIPATGSTLLSTSNIAAMPDGGFAIFYTDFNPGPALTTTDPVMQLFTSAGERVGGKVQLANSQLGSQDFNMGAVLANGDLVATWLHVGGTPGEIRARIISVPVLASGLGSGDFGQAAINENLTAITTFSAADNSGSALAYTIVGGADAAKFQLDPLTHALRFITGPDADSPGDADANNVYDVIVRVSNGIAADDQHLAISINNVIDGVTINGNASGDSISFYQTTRGLARPTNNEDLIYGMDGADTINGQGGDDTIDGGNGSDRLYGSEGNDSLIGGDGNDWLDGGDGVDTLQGGLGNDRYFVNHAGDAMSEAAGAGTDLVWSSIDYLLPDNVENLLLIGYADINGTGNALANSLIGNLGNNVLSGGQGKDTIDGGEGNDSILGGDGADSLIGGLGDDTLVGGIGNDVYILDSTGDVIIEAGSGGIDSVRSELVSITLESQVENGTLLGAASLSLTGNGMANVLTGNSGDNRILGNLGNDTLRGNDGNDTLIGGGGADSLIGGLGADVFRFDVRNASANRDMVSDFVSTTDRIEISRAAFTALAGDPAGVLAAGKLIYGSAATSASDHLIYDPATGRLLYDADGTGSLAASEIARFTGNPAIVAADIWLI